MIIYFILLFSIFAVAAIVPLLIKNKKYSRLVINVYCCVILIFISSFKGLNVGTDTPVYYEYYNKAPRVQLATSSFEIGFRILNFVCSSIHLPFQAFLFICYLAIYVPLFIAFSRHSNSPMLSWLYAIGFFLVFYLSGLRQSIAMSFGLVAVCFIAKKKSWKNVIIASAIILFASLFHKSVLILFILVGLSYIPFKKMYLLISVPVTLVLFLNSSSVFMLLCTMLNNNSYLPGSYGGGGTFFVYLLMSIIIGILSDNNGDIFSILSNKTSKIDNNNFLDNYLTSESDNEENKRWLSISSWSIILSAIFQSFCRANLVFPRFGFYFLIVCAISWPKLINRFRSKTVCIILKIGFVLGVSAFFFLIYVFKGSLNMTPYSFNF